ncbi:MAG: hypothetical protein AB7T10_02490 [bacterium]
MGKKSTFILVFLLSLSVLNSCYFFDPESRYLPKISEDICIGNFSSCITDSLIFKANNYYIEVNRCSETTPASLLKRIDTESEVTDIDFDGKHLAAFQETTLLVYDPITLSVAASANVYGFEGTVEIDDTLLYATDRWDFSDNISVYYIDFENQELILRDSIMESGVLSIDKGKDYFLIQKEDTAIICRVNDLHTLERIGWFFNSDAVFFRNDTVFEIFNENVLIFHLDSGVLECDTISLEKIYEDLELDSYECIYSDGGYLYLGLANNNSSRLFVYSMEENKVLSWTEENLIWYCEGNSHFIYTDIGVYQKQE